MGKHSAKGRARKPREIRPTRARVEGVEVPRVSQPRKRGALEESPELPIHRARRKQRIKRVLIGGAVALVALAAAVAVWAALYIRSINSELKAQDPEEAKRIREALTPVAQSKDPVNLLLLGVDRRPEEVQSRADTIILAKIDPASKRVWMISIPRDTRAEIPGHGVNKINAAHFLGGPALMIDTVEDLLGTPIHHYLEVDFDGFVSIVDSLGGVYVDVDVAIDDWRADPSPGHRARRIDPGYQRLDGEHALTYVRSRDFPDADFTRMRHQQTFFKALADQSTRWDNLLNAPDAFREFAKATTTDMSVGQLFDLARSMRGLSDADIQTATLPGEWREPYVWPDEELVQRLVKAFTEGGDIENARKSVGSDQVAPEDVSVTVRNGGGLQGIAGQAADILESAGFKVGEVGNANQFVYDETLVVYRDDQEAAQAVADALPTGKLVPSRGMYLFNTDVLVVVGKDWPAAFEARGRQSEYR